MDPALAKDLIHQAKRLGATTLSLSGGDPLVYPYSFELIALAESIGYERVLFYTSGLYKLIPAIPITEHWASVYSTRNMPASPMPLAMLQERYGRALPDSIAYETFKHRDDFEFVVIFSMHSALPTCHDYIMGVQGAWYNMMVMMNTLIMAFGTTVEVHTVPMAPCIHSYRDLDLIRDLLAKIGVQKMSLLRFVPQTRGRTYRDVLELPKSVFTKLQAWVHKTQADDHPVEVRIGCPFDYRHALDLLDGKAKPCHAGHDLLLVRPNGDVHPCAAWKTLTRSNVNDQSLKEILLESETFVALRELHVRAANGSLKNVSLGCATCPYLTSCAGGCPAQRLHQAESTNVTDLLFDQGSGMRDHGCPRVDERYDFSREGV